jgi:isocitrate lyase
MAQTHLQAHTGEKRDFGIMATTVVAFFADIAWVTTADVALTQTATMVETVKAVISLSLFNIFYYI